MERRGSGLKKIIESYEFEKFYMDKLKPEFKSTQSSFFVVLRNLNYNLQNDPQNDPQKISRQDRLSKIVEILSENPSTTRIELSKILGVGEATIKRDFSYLKEIGEVKRIGSSKSGKWIVKQK